MVSSIQSICVCGAGTMGSGIAQLAAQRGFHTILYDVNKEMPGRAKAVIEKSLQQLLEKGKITATEKQDTLSRLRFTSDMNDCIADLCIEAIIENAASKAALFNQLHEFNHSEVIFATNTSSLPVSSIAAKVIYPERVVGMHFFNPATLMKLVEVVQGKETSQSTVDSICQLATQLGKTPVLCKDSPGFIVNHVARPYYLEALRLLQNGVDPSTIDSLMEASGFKMGPFKLMDLIGNDINYAVSVSVYEGLGKPDRLAPSPLQQQKVAEGALGKKTGKGFYNY
ncbi:MAG TPA: 3-hydroxyacyl-CoA dehydrogenase NAD-binding domain-containing protein [Chitinophagaceae bacterium]|nr:3-hydroxyacyl-CoA dehydrogenase NAD-binding domain-containing protein [Chitinophagaceae bacterium]